MKRARLERTNDMIILRGLPGSLKSERASEIKDTWGGEIFSTDDYFKKKGRFFYVREKQDAAHIWNSSRVRKAVEKGINPIIIDNTNLEKWEMWPYVRMGYFWDYYVTFQDLPKEPLDKLYSRCKTVSNLYTLQRLEGMQGHYELVRNIFDVLYNNKAKRKWMPSKERILNGW